jgi:hypothetical protein
MAVGTLAVGFRAAFGSVGFLGLLQTMAQEMLQKRALLPFSLVATRARTYKVTFCGTCDGDFYTVDEDRMGNAVILIVVLDFLVGSFKSFTTCRVAAAPNVLGGRVHDGRGRCTCTADFIIYIYLTCREIDRAFGMGE